MASKKKKKSTKKNTKKTFDDGLTDGDILTMANKMVEETLRMERAKDRRDKIIEKLLPAMKVRGLKRVPIPHHDRTIDLKHDTSRAASKRAIVEQFGQQGESFWEELPKKDRWYLSVAKHKDER